jgi:prepilin-type N-terminal cleavage/methylation domain-containing protein
MKKYSQGMTLIEMLVVIGIFAVMSVAIGNTILIFYKTHSYSISQADEVESARRGLTKWMSDVKELTYGEDGSYPIRSIGTHHLAYYSDTDQDNSVEYVVYELATTTLRKYTYNATGTPVTYNLTTPDNTEVLSLYVQNINQGTSTFLYFDTNGSPLSTTSPLVDVRYIQARFIINIDENRYPGEFMLRSSVAPRNLKDNL